MSDEIECPDCDGEGGFPAGGPICCNGSDWECGANGCTGPIDGRYLEMCPSCQGTGWREPTQDEADNMAEDAYQRQFEGEPPMSARERDEMQAKRDAQWGVR